MSDSIREMLCLGSMSLLKPFGASVELEVLKLTGVLGLFPLHSASYGFRRHMSPISGQACPFGVPAARVQAAHSLLATVPRSRLCGPSPAAGERVGEFAVSTGRSTGSRVPTSAPLTRDEPCRTRGSGAWATGKGTRHPRAINPHLRLTVDGF